MTDLGRSALLRRWLDTVRPIATAQSDRVELAGTELLARYADPARAYHNLTHLGELLERLDEIGAPAGTTNHGTVLAAFFHDAVYDVDASDSEERSARYAVAVLSSLGVDAAMVDDVAVLVRATATHDPAAVPPRLRGSAVALFDADLAILAAEQSRYDDYAAGVRREYAHVDDRAFAAGRAAILEALLARQSMFLTPRGHTAWEPRGRRNVTAELHRLRTGGSDAAQHP